MRGGCKEDGKEGGRKDTGCMWNIQICGIFRRIETITTDGCCLMTEWQRNDGNIYIYSHILLVLTLKKWRASVNELCLNGLSVIMSYRKLNHVFPFFSNFIFYNNWYLGTDILRTAVMSVCMFAISYNDGDDVKVQEKKRYDGDKENRRNRGWWNADEAVASIDTKVRSSTT